MWCLVSVSHFLIPLIHCGLQKSWSQPQLTSGTRQGLNGTSSLVSLRSLIRNPEPVSIKPVLPVLGFIKVEMYKSRNNLIHMQNESLINTSLLCISPCISEYINVLLCIKHTRKMYRYKCTPVLLWLLKQIALKPYLFNITVHF